MVGLEERHPPALIGDVVRLRLAEPPQEQCGWTSRRVVSSPKVRLRLAALPQIDIPCRLVAIEKRVHLLFTPALSAGRADGPERHDQHPLCPLLRDASLAKHRGEAPHSPHCRRLRGFVKDTLFAGGLGVDEAAVTAAPADAPSPSPRTRACTARPSFFSPAQVERGFSALCRLFVDPPRPRRDTTAPRRTHAAKG